MREWFGGVAYLGVVAWSLLGAALAVAWVSALPHRGAGGAPDRARMRAGQRRQLRRYAVWWAGVFCAWLIATGLLAPR
ncbi:MAG: hypothetical protein KY467_02990 [Gemmatimonadetes bacterium]|nr:hypothetical protein [Gemmatimonadota bacterium]